MKIVVNGNEHDHDPLTIEELLQVHDVRMPQMVSVQLNERFVEREHFNTLRLEEGDVVDFLYFMGGGA